MKTQVELASAEEAEQKAHKRRLADIQEQGWRCRPEGWVLDTSTGSTQSRELVAYSKDMTSEQAVSSVYARQKMLEAQQLAARQRGRRN